MRLIDADAAVEIIETKQKELSPVGRYSRNYLTGSDREKYDELEYMIDAVNSIPTVDAVPVVRCRDCKHHHWDQEPCHGKAVHTCDLPHMKGVETFKEFFCYFGERRSG